jgi:membrane protein
MKVSLMVFLKRFIDTLEMYFKNGLANHAAACAYGFLLSITPMLLLLAIFIFIIFNPSPEVIVSFINTIPFLGSLFDEQWLSSDLFNFSKFGVSGIISVLSIIWAGRILAVSMQRGLDVTFPGEKKRNPVNGYLISLVIELSVIVFVFVAIFSSRTAVRLYRLFDFTPNQSILQFVTSQYGSRASMLVSTGLASFLVYIFAPANPPRKFSAFQGAFFSSLAFFCTITALGFIIDKARYNFLYGALGNMIIILVNVYFFFIFFFIGAQFAFVRDNCLRDNSQPGELQVSLSNFFRMIKRWRSSSRNGTGQGSASQ